MFENFKEFKTTFAGKPLEVETGKMAGLANGSCLVRYGDTVVLAAATASSKPRDGIDFFPLSVDFEEKLYSVGRIPGSFMRREGRPSEKAILASRIVDRSMRPLFPKNMRNDVSISLTVMSVDPECNPEVTALVGASIAVSISDIPFAGPISGVGVGLINGEIIINPSQAQDLESDMYLTVSSTKDKIAMIEAGAKQVPDETVVKGIEKAHEENQKIIAFIESIVKEIGKPKFEYTDISVPEDMLADIKAIAYEKIKAAMFSVDKTERDDNLKPIYDEVYAQLSEKYPDSKSLMDEALYYLQKTVVRRSLLDEQKRVDGRGLLEIRPLASEVSLLPRVHGSGLFTRGQTQVLTVATLGTLRDAQLLDGIDDDVEKRYMHHYNFPGYSVGEAKPARSPGRREIGHGALAEKALEPVIPPVEEFPYALRLVSEVLSSNGSTSQGAICGSTLALMDAGVPISAPVAGISCGLVTEGEKWLTFVDIQGVEDFFGDMDFKVAGTKTGITAIQMDIKIHGLTMEIIKKAIEQTRDARYYILDEVMLKAIPEPRAEVSEFAPKMITLKINPDKIREVIGAGGKVIQKICADTGAKIDIEDDGSIFISAVDKNSAIAAQKTIESIAFDPEIGGIYNGTVTRLMTFGAFVEIAPGKEGLVHISKLDFKRVEKVEDCVSVGDQIVVKVTEIDDKGRINLSRKDALMELEKQKEQAENAE